MAITATDRFGLPQWGAGADSPSRVGFNAAFAAVDDKAAYDDGAAGTSALPVTDVVAGRYAQTVNGSYRSLYRRQTGAWDWVGGNTIPETLYHRAAAALATNARAREVSHPSLVNPTLYETWDGNTVQGGRLALLEQNAGAAAALHAGDTTTADLTNKGRIYARTTATGHRGIVAAAHANDAGALYTAREVGGSDTWSIDAKGQMRAQAPSVFGVAALAANIPLASAPGTADLTALDLYGSTTGPKPALRGYRSTADATTPIFEILPDTISIGRASWAGATLNLRAPTINLVGALDITGASALDALTVGGTLGVTGTTTLAVLNAGTSGLGNTNVTGTLGVSGASSLTGVTATTVAASGAMSGASVAATGALTGASATITGAVSAEGAKVLTATVGSGAEVRSRPPTQYSGTAQQSVRAPMMARKTVNSNRYMSQARNVEASYDFTVTMPEDGWMRLDLSILFTADTGSSSAIEPWRPYWTAELRSTGSLAFGDEHDATLMTDDTVRQIAGKSELTSTDVFNARIAAGTYTIRLYYAYNSQLSGTMNRIIATVTSVVLHSAA